MESTAQLPILFLYPSTAYFMKSANKTEFETIIRQLCDDEATTYSREQGHGFSSEEERQAWTDEILESVAITPGQTCIDMGAGTGVLSHLIASLVAPTGKVIAQDLSGQSLKINKETCQTNVEMQFLPGDVHDEGLFLPELASAADIITARQCVVLFRDPAKAFTLWRRLLKPSGKVVILDALWTRTSWTGKWRELVDELPLSCLQTLGTIPYLLQQAGFVVKESRFLPRVNQALGDDGTNCPRFIVVAEMSLESQG